MQLPYSRLARRLLSPLGWCYAAGLHADELLDGLRTRVRPARPVVGIGNLAVGGSGKTPTARWLALKLFERGLRPALVTRGYGGSWTAGTAEPGVVDGDDTDPWVYGDEAVLLKRELTDVPVVVGRIKARAARVAARLHGIDVVIVDDALQHRRLARDFDLTVLAATDWRDRLTGAAAPLPAGRLRVPFDRLRKTDATLLLDGTPEELRLLRVRFPRLLCLGARFVAVGLRDFAGVLHPLSILADRDVVACCAIARPEVFFGDLERLGAHLVARLAPPDHAAYDMAELGRLNGLVAENPGALVVVTGKDAVKLRGRFENNILWLERSLRLETGDAAALLTVVTARLERRR